MKLKKNMKNLFDQSIKSHLFLNWWLQIESRVKHLHDDACINFIVNDKRNISEMAGDGCWNKDKSLERESESDEFLK